MKRQIEEGVDVNAKNTEGLTPLSMAKENEDNVTLLVAAGAK